MYRASKRPRERKSPVSLYLSLAGGALYRESLPLSRRLGREPHNRPIVACRCSNAPKICYFEAIGARPGCRALVGPLWGASLARGLRRRANLRIGGIAVHGWVG